MHSLNPPALTFQFPDVEPQTDEHEANGDKADAEADATVVTFNHCIVTGFLVGSRDLEAGLDVLINEVSVEAMDRYAGLGEGVAGLVLIEAGFAHFHSGCLRAAESQIGTIDGLVERSEVIEDIGAGASAMVAGRMTTHADTAGAGTEHGIGGLMDAVVGVANDAAGETLIRKGLAVRALLIHLRLEDVTVGTYVLNLVYARRYGAMIAMAGGTGGCA